MKDSAQGQRPEAISPSIKEIKGGMPPATPPGSPATTPADALEAARRIVDWDKRTAIVGEPSSITVAGALVKDSLTVARALLASKPSAWRSEVLEEAAKVARETITAEGAATYPEELADHVDDAIRALKEKPHG